jgi:hypothetical protein
MMKRKFAYLFVITFLAGPVSTKAQSLIRFTNTFINKLQKANRHPVILFSDPPSTGIKKIKFGSDRTKEYKILTSDYLVYRKGRKSYCRKIVEHFGHSGGETYTVKSEPILIEDSLYLWLTSKIDAIRNEEFAPFVHYNLYKEKMDTLYPFHSLLGGIGIHSAGQSFEKYIDGGCLRKWTEYYRNLNFETNTKSNLFSFYQKLEELFRTNEQRFKFLKYTSK